MSSSDENDQSEIDCDTCTTAELNCLFKDSFRISSEEAISLQKDYVLHLDNSRDFGKLVASTSTRVVHLFDLKNNRGFTELQKCNIDPVSFMNKSSICGVRFGNTNDNKLFVATTDGTLYAYDLRTKATLVQAYENVDIAEKPFTCFDVNADDSILCAGTEKSKNETFVVLFDARKASPLVTFTESHQDDITQVKFHPNKPKTLATGSIDGLINVFDLSESDEDDALEYCLNTESSVQIINWHPKSGDMQVNDQESADFLSCITDTNDFQIFDVEESELICKFEPKEVSDLIKRKNHEQCYLANSHTTSNGDIFLLAGSQFAGSQFNGGTCLRGVLVQAKELKPQYSFNENKQIVRCSVFNTKDNILITGGEAGIVTVWDTRLPEISEKSDSNKLKEKIKTKDSRKSKPY